MSTSVLICDFLKKILLLFGSRSRTDSTLVSPCCCNPSVEEQPFLYSRPGSAQSELLHCITTRRGGKRAVPTLIGSRKQRHNQEMKPISLSGSPHVKSFITSTICHFLSVYYSSGKRAFVGRERKGVACAAGCQREPAVFVLFCAHRKLSLPHTLTHTITQ